MPAPTALRQDNGEPVSAANPAVESEVTGDDDFILDLNTAPPQPSDAQQPASNRVIHIETRKVPIPPHRFSPIKAAWPKVYPPLVEHLKLQVRMNIKNKAVELRNSRFTTDPGALQKGEDFMRALTLGFDPDDAIALLRLDDLYIETFEIKDIRTLQGDHLARAIGRIAGKDGRVKHAIENSTRTRISLNGQKISILGSYTNGKMAREAVVSLVLGARPGKVYQDLRTIATRLKERF